MSYLVINKSIYVLVMENWPIYFYVKPIKTEQAKLYSVLLSGNRMLCIS